jgi:hypothetical protein
LTATDTARNKRRSERVLLQVHALVEAEMSDGKRLRQDAYALVVNADGGRLEMGMRMSVGQGFLIFNLETVMRQACRALRVGRSQNDYFAVAFEFDSPALQFWPSMLPPANWEMVPS